MAANIMKLQDLRPTPAEKLRTLLEQWAHKVTKRNERRGSILGHQLLELLLQRLRIELGPDPLPVAALAELDAARPAAHTDEGRTHRTCGFWQSHIAEVRGNAVVLKHAL